MSVILNILFKIIYMYKHVLQNRILFEKLVIVGEASDGQNYKFGSLRKLTSKRANRVVAIESLFLWL